MNSSRLVILVLAVLSFSCQRIETNEAIVLPIHKADFEMIEFRDFLQNSEFVFLETDENVVLPESHRMLEYVDEFYLLDEIVSEKVFRFDANGKFLNTIGQKGKGPGEYIGPNDAIITDGEVEILAGISQTEIYKYTNTGEFKNKHSIEGRCSNSFIKHPNGLDYFFYYHFSPFKILKTDSSFIPLDTLFNTYDESRTTSSTDSFFRSHSGNPIFCEGNYNEVYQLTEGDFELKYEFDYGPFVFTEGGYEINRIVHTQEKGMYYVKYLCDNKD